MEEYTMNEEERREVSRRFLAWVLTAVAHPSVKDEVAQALIYNIRPEDLQ